MKKIITIICLILFCSGVIFAADSNTPEKDQNWNSIGKESAKEVLGWLREAKEFVLEQSPLICQEIVAWGITENIFGVVVGCCMLYFLYRHWKYTCSKWNQWADEIHPAIFAHGTFFIVLLIATPVTLLTCSHNLLYVWISPRLYLIEYFAKLVK